MPLRLILVQALVYLTKFFLLEERIYLQLSIGPKTSVSQACYLELIYNCIVREGKMRFNNTSFLFFRVYNVQCFLQNADNFLLLFETAKHACEDMQKKQRHNKNCALI